MSSGTDMRTAKAQSAFASAQPDRVLRCPLTESFDTIEYINGEQMLGSDFAYVLDESETVHFARGPFDFLLMCL